MNWYSNTKIKIAQNQQIGFKVVAWDGQRAYSLYQKDLIYDIRPGAIHTNVYMGTSEEFARDYYSGLTDDQDMLFIYGYNPSDIISGGGPNSEVRVRNAKLLEAKLL